MAESQKTWQNTVFWEISDILWTCFGFHWLAKLAAIIKTHGKLSVLEDPWQRMDVLWIHKLAEVIKKPTSRRKLWKNMFFLPCCSVPVIYLFLYLYIYLQSPAVILSSDPPQPIDLLSANLFIYMYIYIYMLTESIPSHKPTSGSLGWGGVGWDNNVIEISTWTCCYALCSSIAISHELDATLYDLQLQFHMNLMLRSMIFNCNFTWTWC